MLKKMKRFYLTLVSGFFFSKFNFLIKVWLTIKYKEKKRIIFIKRTESIQFNFTIYFLTLILSDMKQKHFTQLLHPMIN